MKKKIVIVIIMIVVFIGIAVRNYYGYFKITNVQAYKTTSEDTKQNIKLVIDVENKEVLPKNFRMANKRISSDKEASINLLGLSDLNISGSGAISEKGIAMIKQTIGNKPMVDIDLRQESHGVINGMGISWFGTNDSANFGLTHEQVINYEKSKLNKIVDEKYVKFDELPKGKSVNTIHEISNIEKVMTEEELAKSLGISYLRITVTDHQKPLNNEVDLFINSVKDLPQNTWLHFHCRGGAGRTTTFMSMYDMMHNAKKVGFDDIMKRQFLIGGSDLLNVNKNEDRKKESEGRVEFIRNFYQYCHDNNDDFKTSWSQWCKDNKYE